MFKSASLSESFKERRSEFSTRIGARGDGFEFAEHGSLHERLKEQIPEMVRVLQIAEAAAAQGDDEALAQVNRLRGKLGNFRRIIREPDAFDLNAIFMTIAREVLPQWVFDALLADARWLREREAQDIAALIDAACGAPRGSPAAVTMRNARKKKRRRRQYGQ